MEKINQKECKHQYEKEYIKGMQTGDYVCKICGHTTWGKPYKQKNKAEN